VRRERRVISRAGVDADTHGPNRSCPTGSFANPAERIPDREGGQKSTPYMVFPRRGIEDSNKPIARSLVKLASEMLYLVKAKVQDVTPLNFRQISG
jgi:hypothetical protein